METEPLVVKLSGDLDAPHQDELLARLKDTYDKPAVILDFSSVTYMDSSALSALLVKRRIRREKGYGPARLTALSPSVKRILSVSRLDHIWPIYDRIEDAVASFH